ncbi:MAG: hypothetical protein P8R54_14370 [Myxococcota bacterium]|nr:hypothetical protein [Myxococcota bacterium]
MLALLIGLLGACDDAAPPEASASESLAVEEAPEPSPEAPAVDPVTTTGRLLVIGGTSGVVMVDGESVGQLPMSEPVDIEAGDHALKVLDMKTGRGQELSIHVQAGMLLEIPAED